MAYIHREGYPTLSILFVILAAVNALLIYFLMNHWLVYLLLLVSLGFYGFVLQFFRNPVRHTPLDDSLVYSPADGKVVVIEEVYEKEYFKTARLQVSVFMSPLNVHANRQPISGKVTYYRYHPGKYLVAWHPKSSELNERNTIVVLHPSGKSILMRQIAGAVARRICCYLQEGQKVQQGAELGFIKFGSRVDIFLPLDAQLKVKIGDSVKAGESLLASF